MSNQIKSQTLKGFRDFLPEEKRKRDYVAKKVVEIFERYGFEPLETPTLEYASLLLGKYGDEADKLVYSFKDKGDRELALRYDQTVPTARILAQYQNILPKYFRRYQIQNVFRADKPQKGRYREFTQCDIDIFNSTSPIADAEILATTYFAFKNVGYPKVTLLINDRSILFNTLQPYVTEKVNIFSLIQTLDKLEKIGEDNVVLELVSKGLSQKDASVVISTINKAPLNSSLEIIINYAVHLGIPRKDIKFTPNLARGLDYYTGMIFEVVLPGYDVGSCGGGGRYDKLIEQLGGVSVPAVGIAFGFDRMVEAAESFKLLSATENATRVLVTVFDEETTAFALKTASALRKNDITSEVYPATNKLDKQLKYADRKKIPYVLIAGPEELKKNILKLKNMQTGDQKELTLEELITELKK